MEDGGDRLPASSRNLSTLSSPLALSTRPLSQWPNDSKLVTSCGRSSWNPRLPRRLGIRAGEGRSHNCLNIVVGYKRATSGASVISSTDSNFDRRALALSRLDVWVDEIERTEDLGLPRVMASRRTMRQIDLNLPPRLVQELTDSFKFFDRNGDGKISKEELGAVVRSLGQKVSDAELVQLMSDVDANGDGFIDLQEFIDLNARAIAESCNNPNNGSSAGVEEDGLPGSLEASLRSAFHVFDVDQNGFVSAEELHRVLVGFGDETVSLEDCRDMIQCVDADGDHMINFREFEALMSGTFVY